MVMTDMTGYLKGLAYYQISSKDTNKIIIIDYKLLLMIISWIIYYNYEL